VGEIDTDTRVRVHGGQQLPGQVRLPQLEDVDPRREPVLDRLGRLIGEHPLMIGSSALLAGAGASMLGGGGIVARGLRGVAGTVAGFAGALALGTLAGKVDGSSDPSTTAYVASHAPPLEVAPGTPPERLKVLDWNLHALMGPASDGPRQDEAAIENVAKVVARERPDVLVLQEVQVDSWTSGGRDDLDVLAERLGATDAVLVPNGTRPNGTQKGQAVLTFGATRVQDARGLAHADPNGDGIWRQLVGAAGWARETGYPMFDLGPGFHARTSADVMISTPAGRGVRLLDEHLSGTGGEATGGSPGSTERMEEQLVPVANTLEAWDGPTILAGDFNVRGGTRFGDYEARVLGEHGLRSAAAQLGIPVDDPKLHTYSSTNDRLSLDRIYSSDDAKVTSLRVLRGPAARGGSDHLPTVAEIEIG
jgi:endonuclease/exonuclease/phosphatase family metal-dependent hydrolase